jgi:uncharacterized membrane protein YhhN
MVFVEVAVVFAIANWVAVETRNQRLEYISKPATTLFLLVGAVALTPFDPAQRWWFVAALAFCLAGDVFLMLPQDLFVPGLASFLVGHIAFIVGMIVRGVDLSPIVILYAIVMALLARPVITAVQRDHKELLVPVCAYILVIGAMLVVALSGDSLIGAEGGVMFVASDRILAHNRFIRPFRHAQLAIMTTYHAALVLLVLSLRA